jgi:hypothetical protein
MRRAILRVGDWPGLIVPGYSRHQSWSFTGGASQGASGRDKQRRADGRVDDREPMPYCPVCSLRLTERKCKLFCERCGYYMSCADYY